MTVRENHALEGKRLPDVTFKTRVRDEAIGGDNPFRWQDMTTADFFAGKRVVVFGLPGAFTPTCSNEQCPAYERSFDALASHGVEAVYCISVNDAFVMYQWGLKLGVHHVKLIPDGSAHFTRGLGMLVNKDHLGFGERSWRYAMVVNDGVVEAFFEEPGRNDHGEGGDPYTVSDPGTILRYLEGSRPA